MTSSAKPSPGHHAIKPAGAGVQLVWAIASGAVKKIPQKNAKSTVEKKRETRKGVLGNLRQNPDSNLIGLKTSARTPPEKLGKEGQTVTQQANRAMLSTKGNSSSKFDQDEITLMSIRRQA